MPSLVTLAKLFINNENSFAQRIHWKRASKANHGLMLTSPLRSVDGKFKNTDASTVSLLRPQDLR